MVVLMERNPGIAKGFHFFNEGKDIWKSKWMEFSHKLNSFGPPIRNGDGWQKVCISMHKTICKHNNFNFYAGLGRYKIWYKKENEPQ